MAFFHNIGKYDPLAQKDPLLHGADKVLYGVFGPKTPPPTPGVPNPNDAANQAQNLTDQMRMRRGLMANIYAGNQPGGGGTPQVGKVQLGT